MFGKNSKVKGVDGSNLLGEADEDSLMFAPPPSGGKGNPFDPVATGLPRTIFGTAEDGTMTVVGSAPADHNTYSQPFNPSADDEENASECNEKCKEKFLTVHTYLIQPTLNHGPAFCLSMFAVNYFANANNVNFINAMPDVVRAGFVMALPPLTSHVLAPLNNKATGWSFRQDWFGVRDTFPTRDILVNAAFTTVTFGMGLFAYGVSGNWWEGITDSPIIQTMAQGAVGSVVMFSSKRLGGAVSDSYQELKEHQKELKNQVAQPSEKKFFAKLGAGLSIFSQHLVFPGQRAEEERKKRGFGNR